MAVKGSFPIKVDSNVHGFTRVLKSAACEWLLLFLLLLDAAFSYSLTKFAQYCELQLPCILCSRLDHILGKENPDFYVNLLCNNHKSEISSLISCHNHGKLVDVHGMCEECLLSFAKNDSKEEAYKILVGKLGSECIQKPLVNLDINSGSLTTKFCSCCSKPWRSRPSVQKMVQSKLPSAPVSNPEIPSPKSPGHRCLNSQQGLKNRRDRFLLPTKPLVLGSRDHDSLSHVGYTEVKISSDSESDFPFSDDDDLINVPRNWKMNEFLSRQGSKFTPKSQYADVFPAVQRQKSTPATSNLMLLHLEPEKGETTTPRFISNSDLRKGLGELNWQQLIKKASPLVPELVSLDDIPLSSSAQKGSPAISADEGDRVSLSNMLDSSGYTDFISHKTALSSENVQLPARLSKENCIKTKEIGDTGLTSAMNNWESIDLDSTSTLSSRKDAALVPNNNSVIGARDLAPITIKDVKASNSDPVIFTKAAAAVCQLESSAGRTVVVLSKEKEKEKERSKVTGATEGALSSNEPIRIPEMKVQDGPGKGSKGHKKIPVNLAQVIDQLLEIILQFPCSNSQEDCSSYQAAMEVDEPGTSVKGKSKIDEATKGDSVVLPESSAALAKVIFVLKLLSDILLMYVHAISVVLKRDSEICQLRVSSQLDSPGQGGIVHHVLHKLLPFSSDKSCKPGDLRAKLSEKASWFLVVLCGRSSEGRRRVISELVKALSLYTNLDSNSLQSSLLPDRKVSAFVELAYSVLSKNASSSSLSVSGYSPDIARGLIDGGIVPCLSSILQAIDLDHPDASKIANLILKALESLTRAANASEQSYKSDVQNKKKSNGSQGRSDDQTTNAVVNDNTQHNDNRISEQEAGNAQVDGANPHEGAGFTENTHGTDVVRSDNQDVRAEGEGMQVTNATVELAMEFPGDEMEEGDLIHNSNRIGMEFHIEHRADEGVGDEDDDMGGEGEEEEDEEDDDGEDEDEDIAEDGTALMSLADTDVDDHEDAGFGDDYNDEMIDDEEDDYHENRVIEVRWREALARRFRRRGGDCEKEGERVSQREKRKREQKRATCGTLSPMDSFAYELKLEFPIRLENPHVISSSQIWAGVVPVGPSNYSFNSSYRTRDVLEYKQELGNAIVNFARIVPDGLLVFFPSYYIMENCISCWKDHSRGNLASQSTIWERICKFKQPVIEPRQSSLFSTSIEDFTSKLNNPSTSGAVFFAVCRGKVSEGLDFADQYGRAVIVTGLPFALRTDPKVRLKREFLDEHARDQNTGHKPLTGEAWYDQQASRAVNQAVGRVIRHRHDYGAIIFCDERFASSHRQAQVSRWIQPHIQCYSKFGDVVYSLTRFFRAGAHLSVKAEPVEAVYNGKACSEKASLSRDNCCSEMKFKTVAVDEDCCMVSSSARNNAERGKSERQLYEFLPANQSSLARQKQMQPSILLGSGSKLRPSGTSYRHLTSEIVDLTSNVSSNRNLDVESIVSCSSKRKGVHELKPDNTEYKKAPWEMTSGIKEVKLKDTVLRNGYMEEVKCPISLTKKLKSSIASPSIEVGGNMTAQATSSSQANQGTLSSSCQNDEAKGHNFLAQVQQKLNESEYKDFVGYLKALKSKTMKIGSVLQSIAKLFSGQERLSLLKRFKQYIPEKYHTLYEEYCNSVDGTDKP